MSAQTGLWLVVGHTDNGSWQWGFLTVRAGCPQQAARAAARFTKEVSSLLTEEAETEDGLGSVDNFPTSWVVTELLLGSAEEAHGMLTRHPEVIHEESSETKCAGTLRGGSVSLRLVQGAGHVVRL